MFYVEARQSLREPWMRRYLQVAIALMVSLTLSLVWARISPVGFSGKFTHFSFGSSLAKFWYLLWPLVLVPALTKLSFQGRYQVLRAWVVAFFVLSCIGWIQHFTGWPRPQGIPGFVVDGRNRFHATLFLGHHLSVASILIFPFFVGLNFFLEPNQLKNLGLSRRFLGVILLVGFGTLFLTFSRTLWVALPIGILLLLFWNFTGKWRVVLSLVFLSAFLGMSQVPVIRARLSDGIGVSSRQELWKANWEFFKLRPLLGVGWRQNQELSGIYFESIRPGQDYFQGHAHNNFLDMLAGTGLLGTLSWLAWCIFAFWVLRGPLIRREAGARGLVCAWIVFHINGLTQLNFWEGKVTHQLVSMMALALVWSRESK